MEVTQESTHTIPTNPFLVEKDEKHFAELSADKNAFPITLPNNKELLVWMNRPEDNLPVINLYKDGELGLKMRVLSDNHIELKSADPEKYRPFFNRFFSNFTKLDGTELTSPKEPDEQREWVKNHPGISIEAAVVSNGVLSLSISSDTEDSEIGDELSLDEELTSEVRTNVSIFDVESRSIQKVVLTHFIREIKEPDSRKWNKASGNTEMQTEKMEYQRKENHDMIRDLYVSVCDSLDGALINGVVCTESNKNDWLRSVPYNWMYLVVNRVFRGSRIKNA